MSKEEANIRKAAEALLAAIDAGKAAGVHVQWPQSDSGLAEIAISETAKAAKPADDKASDRAA